MVQIILQPLAIPGAPFTWHSGETWQVTYSFKYISGVAETVDVYLDIKFSSGPSITRHVAHETLVLAVSPDPNNPTTRTSTLTLTVPSTDITIAIGLYDLILNVGGTSISEPGAIDVQAGTGHYTLFKQYIDPSYTSSYSGWTDTATIGFSVLFTNIPGSDLWVTDHINSLIAKAVADGGMLLSYKLYRSDTALQADFQLELIVQSPLQAEQALAVPTNYVPQVVPIVAIAWAVIAVVALIGLIYIGQKFITPWQHLLIGSGTSGDTGLLGSIGQFIPLILIMVIMKMMMEGMQPAGTPKPMTENVVKGAKAVGRGVGYVVEKGAPIIGSAITGVTTAVTKGINAGQQQSSSDTTGDITRAYVPPSYEEGYGI